MSRRRLAGLALAGIFGVAMVWIVFDFAFRLPLADLAHAFNSPTPTATETPLPTRVAYAVDTATPTPTRTPTITPSPLPTLTRKPTATTAPTKKPTNTPAASASTPKTAQSANAPTATPTATPVSVGETYSTISVISNAAEHGTALAELSLTVRGFAPFQETLGLKSYDGPFDAGAPQLYGLFSDNRTPTFNAVYQVNNWDWNCDCRGALLADPNVTLASMATSPGEIIYVPRSSYYIGHDFQAMVLYADGGRITFNYTRDGDPVRGYTIYLEGVAVDSSLLALYQQTNASGRGELPALLAGQGVGKALGSEIRVAIRDAGAFMDPRSRKDWWHGR